LGNRSSGDIDPKRNIRESIESFSKHRGVIACHELEVVEQLVKERVTTPALEEPGFENLGNV
jgi:hypothetical protein